MKEEVSKGEVMELFLQACPSYKKRWDSYIQDNYETGDEQLLYIDFADFATHVVDSYKQNELNEFSAVFDVIELLLTTGDAYVKEAATIGLLEDLQNKLLYSGRDTSVFNPYLHRESLKWWNHLNDFWDGKTKSVGGPER
ncbi:MULTISPECIES: hypothetical protein [unclassified Exiguobacterium]|uniref:DUF7674 family protein n=1 Tax=unclassified Exiguobacterium TaxID=2644629 RepID=UPI00104091C9|nr:MULTISPECIES: hypothetical protein [unclassified Exiguobacterium]TCI43505.1 hypothetical protein EVJ31_11575 [Exiguobacterium sp. SH5S32]TCI52453.1 hypothetical protein EVJ25_06770 [Exiguobacterium sp. SH1S4]TCI68760.1 hypothetical protein EVJ23_11565 [Exiguobacterium sp. SH1S1]